MNISTLINRLEELKEEHGDIDVTYSYDSLDNSSVDYVEIYESVTNKKYVELS